MRHIAMRSTLRVGLISILLGVHIALAQEALRHETGPTGEQIVPEPQATTGCRLLWEENEKLLKYLREHPEALSVQKTAGPAWNFVVGSQYNWWATSFVTNTEYQVPSTCRAVGTNAYYFVEDSLWNRGRVTQAQVDSIAAAFDFRTPAFPTRGIYQVDVETFGDPPNVDNDPRIIILILDIKDGYTGTGSFVAGYFFSLNQFPDGTFTGRRSNHAEIFYQDAEPLDLASPGGLTSAIRTTAHEFQHMIHWNYDRNELTFINEACSEVAEVIIGYPVRGQSLYVNNPNVHLLQWNRDNPLPDYARAARWGLYLWNQFPNDYLKKLVQSTFIGIAGMDAAFAAYPTTKRFDDVFRDWFIANYLNDRSHNANYGYTYSPLLKAQPSRTYLVPTVPATDDTVRPLAATYIRYSAGSNLRITFASAGGGLAVKAIEIGATRKRVIDVPLNFPFEEPLFGRDFNEITFVVMNTSTATEAIYTYSSSGSGGAESTTLSYEGNAAFFTRLPSTVGTSYAVRFSPPVSGQLSSVNIAFNGGPSGVKGTGRLNFKVHENAAGSVGGIPGNQVGSTMSVPFSSLVPGAYNEFSMVPANVNVTAGLDFHVSVDVTGGVGDTVQLLVDDGLGQPTNRTSAYRAGALGLGWYNFMDPNSGISRPYNLLLRATILYIITNVERVETLLPAEFSLFQNYPNPFNPSTNIQYQLPTSGLVQLKIYDVLGREIRTLLDEHQEAGTYRTEWDGKDNRGVDAVSGVYFYQLRTKSFVQTKKMVLVR